MTGPGRKHGAPPGPPLAEAAPVCAGGGRGRIGLRARSGYLPPGGIDISGPVRLVRRPALAALPGGGVLRARILAPPGRPACSARRAWLPALRAGVGKQQPVLILIARTQFLRL